MLENRLEIGLYGLLIRVSRVPLILLLHRLRLRLRVIRCLRLLAFHKLLEFA